MKLRSMQLSTVLFLTLCLSGAAQAPIQPVQWTESASPPTVSKPATRIVLELSGQIEAGWHVYGLGQQPGGPTPLRVTLDDNDVVQVAGQPSGTSPIKRHDPSFGMETEVYSGTFAVSLPVQIKQGATAGKQQAPVSIRFQACNDRICLPPRTIHLFVPFEVTPGS